ncbi:MAG: hypothetical protein E7552_04980 [Ruminococcaceae bacterium]|nr:hypothetical protein [Oscillospiraceae bacterium]
MKLGTDKLWGVNAHHRDSYSAYRPNEDEAIRLAAELGCTIYRINYNPSDERELAYIRGIIRKCHDHGMQVMLALDRFKDISNDIIARNMAFAAENLKDEVEYFQIFNETDIWCSMGEEGGYDISDWTGMSEGYYNPERVTASVEKMKTALETFQRVAPEAKTVINIGSRHYPILDWYVKAGLRWDITAFDIYELDVWDHHAFFREMEERYPTDFMVVECNYPANSGPFTEEAQAEWLTSFLKVMDDYKSDRMKAVIIYELLDQPEYELQKGSYHGESHFGLVRLNPDNSIDGKKRSFTAVQKLFKGE